jgi:hypothetical protein
VLLSLAVAVAAQRVLPPFEHPSTGRARMTDAEWLAAVTECEAHGGAAVLRAGHTRDRPIGVVCVAQFTGTER